MGLLFLKFLKFNNNSPLDTYQNPISIYSTDSIYATLGQIQNLISSKIDKYTLSIENNAQEHLFHPKGNGIVYYLRKVPW